MGKFRKTFFRKIRGHRITQLFARDGTKCSICGEALDRHVADVDDPKYVTFDHIIPRSKGGLDLMSNLRLAHRLCNGERGCDPILPEDER